jgi:VWFA-related protein
MRTVTVVLIAAWLASAQTPVAPAADAVFTVTSTLVQVDAVVTDSKGHHVTDLKPEDFQVFEDGKPQKLTHFSFVRVIAERKAESAAVAPKPAANAAPPAPLAQVRREDVRRTIVLMVDDLGLSFNGMAFVRSSLRKFVNQQLQPGDLVAICRSGGGSGAMQQFTVDKRVLLSVIDSLRYNFNGRFGVGYFEPYGQPLAANTGNSVGGAFDVSYNAERKSIATVGTLGALDYIVGALRDLPGRKSIVLFSEGFQLFGDALGMNAKGANPDPFPVDYDEARRAVRRLIDRANRSGTVIYTINASGLQAWGADASDKEQASGRDLIDITLKQNLSYLADKTGGLAYQDGNDLNWALDRVLEDQEGYYLLGYRPPDGTLQMKNGRSDFHRIEVKVALAGLHVRSRSGFFGETDEQTLPKFQSEVEQLRASMLSPFRSSDVDLRLTALYAESTRQGPVVRNLLLIKGSDLTWKLDATGAGQTEIVLMAIATGAADQPLATVGRVFDVRVPAEKMGEVMRDGALYTLDVPVPRRGAFQIRVAVQDQATKKVGSATQFLQIPDLKRAGFALTSVILRDREPSPDKSDLPGVAAALRKFPRGGSIEFLCAVENGRGKNVDLETRVRLLRDGQEVYAAAVPLVELKGAGRAVFGGLKLAGNIAPGDYDMQVIATERGGGKGATAGQWTNFTVLP